MTKCNKERVKIFTSDAVMVSEMNNSTCEQNLIDADFIDFKTNMDNRHFYEKTDWNLCEDLIYVQNEEALWQTIVGEIKTPKGALSNSIGQAQYGCEIWDYKGAILNSLDISEIEYYIIQCCLKYPEVNNVLHIETFVGDNDSLFIELTIDSIYGNFDSHLRIPTAFRSDKSWRPADTKFFS